MIAQLKSRLFDKTKQQNYSSEAAYDIWAASYDDQPENLMLALDKQVFSALLDHLTLKHQHVVDIGCGTGRHWAQVFLRQPACMTGLDVSAKMLEELQSKYPQAQTLKIAPGQPLPLVKRRYDVLLSTLTVAHIENIEQAVQDWAEALKERSAMLITDFHPEALARGGKRTFESGGRSINIINYVHGIPKLLKLLRGHGFELKVLEERFVDEQVKHYYEKKNALPVYYRFKNQPMIYGMLLTRGE